MKKIISLICIFLMLSEMTTPAYAAKKDTTAPTITKTAPTDYDSDIMIESTIILRFDESIQKGKNIAKISLKESDLKEVKYTYEIKDNFLILTPKADFKYNTIYTVNVPAKAVKDTAGNNLAKDYYFDFITEVDPAEAASEEQKPDSIKYIMTIEATMDEELTDTKLEFYTQILNDFGIEAKFLDVQEEDDKSTNK